MSIKSVKTFPVIYQDEAHTCGLCCCEMIHKFHGIDSVNLRQRLKVDQQAMWGIPRIFGTDTKGVLPWDLQRVLRRSGFETFQKVGPLETLPYLAVALVESMTHWVVAIQETRNFFWIVDPLRGLLKVSKDRFRKDNSLNVIIKQP